MTKGDGLADALDDRMREQERYYRARAREYDAWADRRGAYDRGSRNQGWFAEKDRLAAALDDFRPAGDILEIAGGTGQWTRQLVDHSRTLTVIDAADEALSENRRRLGADAGRVEYHRTSIFDWTPPRRYDVVFFSYWLSHVPPAYFGAFWDRVAACLAPDGRVFLIDNIATDRAASLDPEAPGDDPMTVLRSAPDGQVYRVWKVLWRPDELRDALAELGWAFEVYPTGTYFMWAEGRRAAET
jgi:demethylmenaquinone methyltransferase/2-methoxy-6-polyprenyl-1,4-benzoquinol methylase